MLTQTQFIMLSENWLVDLLHKTFCFYWPYCFSFSKGQSGVVKLPNRIVITLYILVHIVLRLFLILLVYNIFMFIFTFVNCFTGHPMNFVEYHSMGVPMVLCHYRLHPHSECSSMRSGAKWFGNVLWGPFGHHRWLPTDGKFPFEANLSPAGLIYNNLNKSM